MPRVAMKPNGSTVRRYKRRAPGVSRELKTFLRELVGEATIEEVNAAVNAARIAKGLPPFDFSKHAASRLPS